MYCPVLVVILVIKIVLILVHICQYALNNKTILFCCLAVAGGMNTHQKISKYVSCCKFILFVQILTNNDLRESWFGSWDFALLDFFDSLSINVHVMTQFFVFYVTSWIRKILDL